MAYTILNHPSEIKSSPFSKQLLEETKTTKTPNFATPTPTTAPLKQPPLFPRSRTLHPISLGPAPIFLSRFYNPIFMEGKVCKERKKLGRVKENAKRWALKASAIARYLIFSFFILFSFEKYFSFLASQNGVKSLREGVFFKKKYTSRKYPFLLTWTYKRKRLKENMIPTYTWN